MSATPQTETVTTKMVICIIAGTLQNPNHAEHNVLFVHGTQSYNHKVMIKKNKKPALLISFTAFISRPHMIQLRLHSPLPLFCEIRKQ